MRDNMLSCAAGRDVSTIFRWIPLGSHFKFCPRFDSCQSLPDSRKAFCVLFSFLTLLHKEMLSAPDKTVTDVDSATAFCYRSG